MNKRFTNRLINESSPYLLQHAHNPVDWFAWSEEALSKAAAEDKVILVSIGYSACHWCHVMERESFENEAVASLMNEKFINIKIDREERPDLDHIYMDAVQAMSGSGGWPLNVFLTPDGRPFFGGTYFPPEKAFNRSSWTEVLLGVSQSWKDRKNEIISQAENLTDHLRKANNIAQLQPGIISTGDGSFVLAEQCHAMFTAIMKSADTTWGGFGRAPKFPQTFTIQYLFQYHYFTGDATALKQALLSVDKMLMGGIYDHVGGGLARYSTDNEWLAPHFEKMLYDNALLVLVLCDAWQLTADEKYQVAIRKTIQFIKVELLNKEGGFFAALDADSEGEEGKYYVWQQEEINSLLGKDAEAFCAFFDISDEGNWEGKNILRILTPIEVFVREHGREKDQFVQMLDNCLEKLSVQRGKRVKPLLDDKIILGWNALMVRAIARAATVLQDDDLNALAINSARFLGEHFRGVGHASEMMHTYKNGTAKFQAFLDDYANLIAANIQLYKASFNDEYLKTAADYCNYVIDHFSDDDQVFFFFTHDEQKDIIVRKKEIYDGATPSGNSIMAENLYQLAIIFNQPEWRTRADKMLVALLPLVVKHPGSFGVWATLLLQQFVGMNEIAVIGTDFANISNNILLNFIPNIIIMGDKSSNSKYALLENRPANGDLLIYLCRNYSCLAPVLNVESLIQQIDKTNKITS